MFESIRDDMRSGATELTRRAALELAAWAEGPAAPDPENFWGEMTSVCSDLIQAKRSMAPLVNLASRVLATAERAILSGRAPDTARRAVALEATRAAESAAANLERLGANGASFVSAGATIATLSASESVAAVLAAVLGERKKVTVLLSESRPAREGLDFAARLAGLGAAATLVVDAALPRLVARADIVLVGADTVSEDDFVNKAGTYPLALAAREAGVPFYVAALLDKFLPKALRLSPAPSGDAAGAFGDGPPGVEVEDHSLETVPLSLVRGIITEGGVIEPSGLPATLAGRPIAPALLPIIFPKGGRRPR
jgi:translation initiation factor 2B subunit (eIF-2B alpha/beta/delta family)